MLNIQNLKFPILIVSPPRCGSNLLASYIINQTGIKPYLEPDLNPREFMLFKRDFYKDNKHLIKIMSHNLNLYSFIGYEKYYKIRITRRNVIEQCASQYIANIRNKWIYFKNENNASSSNAVPIDIELLKELIRKIKISNAANKSLNLNIDCDIFYEDEMTRLSETSSVSKTPIPLNYNELIDEAKTLYHADEF